VLHHFSSRQENGVRIGSKYLRGNLMRSCKIFGTVLATAALVSLVVGQPALGYEGVGQPPHPLSSNAPPPTDQSNWAAMQRNVQRRFNEASGGGNALTQDQARRAGWGWISDNFSEIDTQRTGRTSLDDINRFMQQRWSQHVNASGPNWSPWNGSGGDWDNHAYNYPYERDVAFVDPNKYDTGDQGSIALKAVTEQASLKQHTITINGKSVTFTARAGHLTASKVDATGKTATTSANGQATPGSTPEATIFYTAYTRDDLPKRDRPVTFFWNGGPGSSTIWLHMGSFGPQFLDSNAPVVPVSDYANPPASFPLKDNPVSLLDETDLVFVDPPGVGLSTAIAPHVNPDFWQVDADAQVVADFITRYINVYNRQSSPKYLYGESYGGIRTPIVAHLLEQDGTANYLPDSDQRSGDPWRGGSDSSSHAANVLNGVVLGSPILNYDTNCNNSHGASCDSFILNGAMLEDYFGLTSARGTLSRQQYFDEVSDFVNSPEFFDYNSHCNSPSWAAYIVTPAAQGVVKKLQKYVPLHTYWGLVDWTQSDSCFASQFGGDLFTYKIGKIVGFKPDIYDGRMILPFNASYNPKDFLDAAYYNQFIVYLTTYVNYSNKPADEAGQTPNSDYNENNGTVIANWNFTRNDGTDAQSLADIAAAIASDPNLKFTVLHGWDDLATPETQTLWDLEGAALSKSVPIQTFEGGHMTYDTDSSRLPLKNALVSFYRATTTTQSGTCDREASQW
jgi:carboxypeptidase C (cathepsin A)